MSYATREDESSLTHACGITAGRALMISAGYMLKKLAHEHNVAVLVSFLLDTCYAQFSA